MADVLYTISYRGDERVYRCAECGLELRCEMSDGPTIAAAVDRAARELVERHHHDCRGGRPKPRPA